MYALSYLSFSAIKSYITDRQLFHKRYIRKEYDRTIGASMMEGSIVHKMIEEFYKTKIEQVQYVDKYIERHGLANTIVWGKTTNLEKSKNSIIFAYNQFLDNRPTEDMSAVECKFSAQIKKKNGHYVPIPMKGVIDAVNIHTDKEGNEHIDLYDWKICTVLTSKPKIVYYMQAIVYLLLCEAVYHRSPDKIIFFEIKKTKNRDKTPQVRQHVFRTEEIPQEYIDGFLEVVDRVCAELAGTVQILPTFDDESFLDFLEQLKQSEQFQKEISQV